MIDYNKLWKFVGKELGISRKARVKVEFLSSEKIILLAKRNNELFLEVNARMNNVSKEEILEYLRVKLPNFYLTIVSPKEVNGLCFTLPLLKKQGVLEETVKFLPTKNPLNYDILIYINEGNLEKRRQQWTEKWRKYGEQKLTLTIEDTRTFLVIHEMIHGLKRLSGRGIIESEQEPFDIEASRIFWKWKKTKVQ